MKSRTVTVVKQFKGATTSLCDEKGNLSNGAHRDLFLFWDMTLEAIWRDRCKPVEDFVADTRAHFDNMRMGGRRWAKPQVVDGLEKALQRALEDNGFYGVWK